MPVCQAICGNSFTNEYLQALHLPKAKENGLNHQPVFSTSFDQFTSEQNSCLNTFPSHLVINAAIEKKFGATDTGQWRYNLSKLTQNLPSADQPQISAYKPLRADKSAFKKR
jgi:hypothetical protein